jgi:hypothetical protein
MKSRQEHKNKKIFHLLIPFETTKTTNNDGMCSNLETMQSVKVVYVRLWIKPHNKNECE